MLVSIAGTEHTVYANVICETIQQSALVRGTGIAIRTPEYILTKIISGNAVIAIDDGQFAGFCYIETWDHGEYVVHSGLIVHPIYRYQGLALRLKQSIFMHSRQKYPKAKIFGITTGLAVMKINSSLGYQPVTFSSLTTDSEFWDGCSSCKNYAILQSNDRSMCLCTGMLYDPSDIKNNKLYTLKTAVWMRLQAIKKKVFIKHSSKEKK